MQYEGAIRTLTKEQLVFVVKWMASFLQILGYAATSFGLTPWNLYLFLFGVLGWFAVGALWSERALMLVHLVAFAAVVAGMVGA